MMSKLKKIRHSLVFTLIVSVGTTYLTGITVWGYWNVHVQKEQIMENIVNDTVLLCNTIKLGTHYAMMQNSRNDINQTINNIAKQKEIETIRIYNKEGQIKFSNEKGEADRFTNIKAEACMVCHKSTPPSSKENLEKRTRLLQKKDGTQYLGIITAIENEPGCSSALCHVHSKDQTVLGVIDVVFSLAEKEKMIIGFEKGVLVSTVIVFFLTAIVIAVLMLKFLRQPIHALIRETENIAEGNYHVTLKETDNEIGQLAGAINKMAKKISGNQTELQKQKDEYRNLFELVPCEITVLDKNYRLVRYNGNFAKKFNPVIGDYCYHAYKGLDHQCVNCPVKKTFQDGKPHYGEETGMLKNGNVAHWILATAPMKNPDGEIVAAMEISLDITNTRILQNKLAQTERKYYAIFNNIPNAVFVLDFDTLEILDCNQNVESVYGFSREGLLNRTFMTLFNEEERQKYASQLRTSNVINQVKQQHGSGRSLYVNIRISISEYGGRRELLVTTSDITKRLEAEQQMIQTGKMATLGEMATGIAHELNQPLSVIKTASGFILRKTKKKEPIQVDIMIDLMEEIDSHIDRASKIINHMREFGRKSDLTLIKVNINEVVKKAFEIFCQQLKVRGIQVIWELDEAIAPISADPQRLEQVFINLLLNARDAIEEKMTEVSEALLEKSNEGEKKITIRTKRKGESVVVEVEDTGKGIQPELIDKIFEPFFTTKEVGKGTGLGLSISYGIIKDCGGTIYARSNVPEGACFVITFPPYQETDQDEFNYHTSYTDGSPPDFSYICHHP